jgi:hypothetical protein
MASKMLFVILFCGDINTRIYDASARLFAAVCFIVLFLLHL